ncbi:PadR family transcriptional regulator [Clostridium gasigenes]|nr:PadR family transcriptional regulator [Clostridium gasigenes]
MDESQLLKGILEGCVLSIISHEETYGYEILVVLEKYGFKDIYEGTLYPLLSRLEKKNLISCRIGKSPLGPKRKYYSITEDGQKYYEDFKSVFQEMTINTNKIINAKEL